MFNADHDAFQGCTANAGWVAFHEPTDGGGDPCANSPSPGQVCADGSVYAGLSPDGSVPMYTTPADAGLFTWNNGTANWVDTAMANCSDATPGTASSCRTGESNTTLLVGLSDAASPYDGAAYCDGLTNVHGNSDWYLPAQDELDVMYGPRAAIGGFDISGTWPASFYLSSSEHGDSGFRSVLFSDGSQRIDAKDDAISVRCVRK